jgi:hypothetical protein
MMWKCENAPDHNYLIIIYVIRVLSLKIERGFFMMIIMNNYDPKIT